MSCKNKNTLDYKVIWQTMEKGNLAVMIKI